MNEISTAHRPDNSRQLTGSLADLDPYICNSFGKRRLPARNQSLPDAQQIQLPNQQFRLSLTAPVIPGNVYMRNQHGAILRTTVDARINVAIAVPCLSQ
jgi:hypothetical protein